jgi:hypothetical protein
MFPERHDDVLFHPSQSAGQWNPARSLITSLLPTVTLHQQSRPLNVSTKLDTYAAYQFNLYVHIFINCRCWSLTHVQPTAALSRDQRIGGRPAVLHLLNSMEPGWWWLLRQACLVLSFTNSPHKDLQEAAAVATQAGLGCSVKYMPTDPAKHSFFLLISEVMPLVSGIR